MHAGAGIARRGAEHAGEKVQEGEARAVVRHAVARGKDRLRDVEEAFLARR
jgi:hypothetical protein